MITGTEPTWADPANERFIPPVVMNPFTGADYDTLLSMLNGWVVQVHLADDDGAEHIGTVTHTGMDDHIYLADEDGNNVDRISLANVRWLQVL